MELVGVIVNANEYRVILAMKCCDVHCVCVQISRGSPVVLDGEGSANSGQV